ncbi:MAG: protein-disulfide reductase DsbD domain-containing protein, partial [Terracidiphilus sp.]
MLLSPAACTLPVLAASSADAPHVHVQLMSGGFGSSASGELPAAIYFQLEPGWHIYWKNPGDAGEPVRVNWTLPAGITAEPIQFLAPKRLPLGPLMDYGYEDEAFFPVKLHAAASLQPGSQLHLAAKVSWIVCQASCIPGKAMLDLDVPLAAGKGAGGGEFSALSKRFEKSAPRPLPAGSRLGFSATTDGFRLTVETGRRESEASFFPAEQDIVNNPAPQRFAATARGFTLDLKKDANLKQAPKQLNGLVELSGGRTYEIAALPGLNPVQAVAPVSAAESKPVAQPPAAAPASPAPAVQPVPQPASAAPQPVPQGPTTSASEILRAVALAFLGGLLLNLMPCVFPVLFLKGLALVRSGHHERATRRAHGLVYAAGILVSFWVLVGVLLGLRAAGATLGWGFQFQSPVFLALMAGLLFFLGLSLAGEFEIGLTLTSAGGSLAAKQGYTGSFFTGILAVIVATPCTAPFMGAAIGYALAQTAGVTFAVFTALALGLAAPYVALTLHPAWTRWLPRPGAWMEILRQAVSVPIFATVVWLAWVLAQAYGANLLAALLAGFVLLAVAGWFLG